jgi:hypothetical protein
MIVSPQRNQQFANFDTTKHHKRVREIIQMCVRALLANPHTPMTARGRKQIFWHPKSWFYRSEIHGFTGAKSTFWHFEYLQAA